jgi:hypothetical protein
MSNTSSSQSLHDPREPAVDPLHREQQRRSASGEFDIRIGRDGTWFYHGSPIARKPLVKLFASVLRRTEAGEYWLVTPVERGRIIVEDAPFVAVEVTAGGGASERVLTFRTNLDDEVVADADHPIRVHEDPGTGEPRPYILVGNGLEARILRSVFYHLADIAERRTVAGEELYGVWSRGVFFPLGRIDRPG